MIKQGKRLDSLQIDQSNRKRHKKDTNRENNVEPSFECRFAMSTAIDPALYQWINFSLVKLPDMVDYVIPATDKTPGILI